MAPTATGGLLSAGTARERAGTDLPPLSVTKDRGVILQSEKYNKRIATDGTKYLVGVDGQFAFDPMSLYYGSIGRIRKVGRGLISPDYVVFSADSSVDPEYLEKLLRFPEMHKLYESLSETGNMFGKRRRLYWSVFEKIELALPPMWEQRKIAAILSAVDEAIAATAAVISHLQVVKKSMMAELLTRGLPGRHTKYKSTEIGEIPESWQVGQLGTCLDRIEAGWSPQCEGRVAQPDEWGVLKVSAVSWGEYRESENKRLPSDLAPRPETEVRDGDLLVSRANTSDLVGRCVFVERTRPKLMLSDKLLRLRTKVGLLLPQFLRFAFDMPLVRQQIEDGSTGSSALDP